MNVFDGSPPEIRTYKFYAPIDGGIRYEDLVLSYQEIIIQSKYITFKGFHNDKLTIFQKITEDGEIGFICKDSNGRRCSVLFTDERKMASLLDEYKTGITFYNDKSVINF